jgi:hypothetical protein
MAVALLSDASQSFGHVRCGDGTNMDAVVLGDAQHLSAEGVHADCAFSDRVDADPGPEWRRIASKHFDQRIIRDGETAGIGGAERQRAVASFNPT